MELNKTNHKEKWIIDTDPGCDDMMAILYMMTQRDAEILMITTIDGNVCLENVTKNIKKILKWSGKTIPIHKGSPNPILKIYENVESYHFTDGLANIEDIQIEKESSIVKIVEYILKNPNEINLLLLGPLTNIAAAYMLEPSICNLVKSVYIMGGSLNSRGNLNCPAEFNFAYDFISTKMILSHFKNVIITPWEPTEIVYIKDHHMESISKNLASKKISMSKHLHFYSSLIIKKYTQEKSGIQFCDLYAAMTIANRVCVNKYSVYELEVVIDSTDMLGMLVIKSRKNILTEMEKFVSGGEFKKMGEYYHLLIENFHEDHIVEDFERIFLLDHYKI